MRSQACMPVDKSMAAGSSRDPPEKQAPMCTLRSFPHNISHCLTFARSEFEGLLEKSPAEANAFLNSPDKYLAAIRQACLDSGSSGTRCACLWPWYYCSTSCALLEEEHTAKALHALHSSKEHGSTDAFNM